MNVGDFYCRPRNVDNEQMTRKSVTTFKNEIDRCKRTVDDEFRNDLLRGPIDGFNLAHVSAHQLWEKEYLDNFGKYVPKERFWECPKCHTKYLTGYPPQECNVCHTISPFGEWVSSGAWKR